MCERVARLCPAGLVYVGVSFYQEVSAPGRTFSVNARLSRRGASFSLRHGALPLLVILATALPRSYMDGSLFTPLSILILLPPSHSPYALRPLRRTPVSPPAPHRPFGLFLTAMAHPVPLGVAQSSYSVTLGILIFIPGRESVWPRPLSSATAHNARIRCQHLPPWLTIAAEPVPRLSLRHTLRAPSRRHSRTC